jgi:peptidyl-tRNA hydrolase
VACRRQVIRRDEAYKTTKLATLCAHAEAPIFATGNEGQVVKIWTESGEMLHRIKVKPQSQQRMGRLTCMSFAPYQLKLATGATDIACSIYSLVQDDKKRTESLGTDRESR